MLQSVLAQAIYDGPARSPQCLTHLLIRRLHVGRLHHLRGAAPVVLQIIDAPRRPRFGVLCLMRVAAFITRAGPRPRRGIDPQLQALAVDVIRECLHVRELIVGLNVPVRIACPFPRIVDVDVHVAGILHPARHHGVGDLTHNLVAHGAPEFVPTVPAHGRRTRQSIVRQWMERRQFRLRETRKRMHRSSIARDFFRDDFGRRPVARPWFRHMQFAAR